MSDTVKNVLAGESRFACRQADCIQFLDGLPAQSVDLVLGSPPYMDARTYGIDAVRGCQEWVDWMLDVTAAAVRVTRGLVLWVAAGVQREKCYWPGCEGLMWEWWKRGDQLWRPCIWWKVDEGEGGSGIPGSGGKQWLRNDWEYVMAFKREGWLPWADPLVMGREPVYDQVGGAMSNRTADGRRINEAAHAEGTRRWGGSTRSADGEMQAGSKDGARQRRRFNRANGEMSAGSSRRPNGQARGTGRKMDVTAGHDSEGNLKGNGSRPLPKVANPGNVLPIVVKARVGGGHMGSRLCHDNEAPYPEALAEFFVRSFCPPGGLVCDVFSGSGTTAAVAVACGRRAVCCDLRRSQVELTRRRVAQAQPPLPGIEGVP